VSVVGQKGPGVTGCSGFRQKFTQPPNKVIAVFVVSKDLPAFNSPDDDVVQDVVQDTRSI
jgi:hypothetical protein